jgi:hypothetical protein
MSLFRSTSDWRLAAIRRTGPVNAAWKDSIRFSKTKGGLSHLEGLTVFITIQNNRTQACVPIKYQLPITSAQWSASVLPSSGFGFTNRIRVGTSLRIKGYFLLPSIFTNLYYLFRLPQLIRCGIRFIHIRKVGGRSVSNSPLDPHPFLSLRDTTDLTGQTSRHLTCPCLCIIPYLSSGKLHGERISMAPPSSSCAVEPSEGCSISTAPVFSSWVVTFASG